MLSRKKKSESQKWSYLRNDVVQWVNKAKFLGKLVDQHINW